MSNKKFWILMIGIVVPYMYIQAIKSNDKIVIPEGSFVTLPTP